MATNFPNQLDNLQNPVSTDLLNSPDHAKQHQDVNDAVEALQSKVGVSGSTNQSTIDYRIVQLESKPDPILGAVEWTANHTLLPGGENTRYLAGDIVYDGGNVYVAKFDNESLPTSNTQYWNLLGQGNRLNIDGRDIPNITYDQLSNKPEAPTLVNATPTQYGTVFGVTNTGEYTSNSALGYNALSDGSQQLEMFKHRESVALGRDALSSFANSQRQANVAIGNKSLLSFTQGTGNIAVGYQSARNLQGADFHISIGYNAANNLTLGSNNITIGSNSTTSGPFVSNEITLGDSQINRFRIPGLGIDWTPSNTPNPSISIINVSDPSYNLSESNSNKWINANGTVEQDFVVMTVSELKVGSQIIIYSNNLNTVSISAGSGVTIQSVGETEDNPLLRTKYSAALLVYQGSQTWSVVGDIV
jgi:hypothetical protein